MPLFVILWQLSQCHLYTTKCCRTPGIMVLITVQFYKPYGDYGFNHRTVYSDYGLGRISSKNFPNMKHNTSTSCWTLKIVKLIWFSSLLTSLCQTLSPFYRSWKSEFLGYNVIITRCSRPYGFNVRPRATKTVLGPRLLRSLRSSDSFGGTRPYIKPIMPRETGWLYAIIVQYAHLTR